MGACSHTEEPFEEVVTPQIVFLFSPGGLGDMSYNDCILEGVQKFKKAHPEVDVFLSSPQDLETAERIFSDWMQRPGSQIPVVFVLASSDYEGLVDKYLPQYPLTSNKRILLFESLKKYDDPHVSTLQVSMYGASFLAGRVAAACNPEKRNLVLLGSSTDIPIQSAKDGFVDGLSADNYDVEYLADDWSGFVMANVAYQRMSEWVQVYGFIFPVAGGSNSGIYRYTREISDAPFLAGMDVDQSALSTRITGSVVKLFDKVIDDYFTSWLQEGEFPDAMIYGLESGYVDWKLSPLYEERFNEIVNAARTEAVEKEKLYYGL